MNWLAPCPWLLICSLHEPDLNYMYIVHVGLIQIITCPEYTYMHILVSYTQLVQDLHSLEKSLYFIVNPWKVLDCQKSLRSPWIFPNIESPYHLNGIYGNSGENSNGMIYPSARGKFSEKRQHLSRYFLFLAFTGIPGNFCTICPHLYKCQTPRGDTPEKEC